MKILLYKRFPITEDASCQLSLYTAVIDNSQTFFSMIIGSNYNSAKNKTIVNMIKSLELTFAIIKPHVIRNPIAHKGVHQVILDHSFRIVHSKLLRIDKSLAEHFYEEHKNKFFYNRLITFMSR